MDDLKKAVLAEKENVEIALRNLKAALDVEEKSIIELAAIATFIYNIYNGVENILKQVLKSKNIRIVKSDSWHKDLLNLAASNEIISEELINKLYEYLSFRHFFIHAYGFMLEESPLLDLANGISDVWSAFLLDIEPLVKN